MSAPPDLEGDGRWMSVHKRFVAEARDKDPEVVFMGDCVLQALGHTEVWTQLFAPLHALNVSIARERTENALWRVQQGALDGLRPKAVVLHLGSDDLDYEPLRIAETMAQLVSLIREKLPDTYILVLTLLPRGQHPNRLRENNEKVNELLKEKISNMPRVELISIDRGFVQADGTISHHDMYDYLSLTNAGCRKAFEPVYESLVQILSEGEKDLTPSE